MTVLSKKKFNMIAGFLIGFVFLTQAIADDTLGNGRAKNPYLIKTFWENGKQIDEIIVPGRPPEVFRAEKAQIPEPDPASGTNTLSDVPAFNWCYGCSATSAAMMAGYYDRTGYSNMYAGPANGGICPLNNTVWGSGECPLSATHQGYDGLGVMGHVDDYWDSYGSAIDPYYGNWTQHVYADCAADFMGTNQYHNWQNTDGSTRFYYYNSGDPLYDYTGCEPGGKRDGCHGVRLFVESRGYTVSYHGNLNQYIKGQGSDPNKGFTFSDFQSEIDAGRPVLIHVTGHTMLSFGYNTTGSIIYIHDTWDHSDHSMTWGGSYSGLQHKGVTVLQLDAAITPTPTPKPTATPTPKPTSTPTPKPTATPTPKPTVPPTPKPTSTPTPKPTGTPTPPPTVTPTPKPTVPPTPRPTTTPTPAPTVTPTPPPTATPTPTLTPTPEPTATHTPKPTLTLSPTPSVTPNPTCKPTVTPTSTMVVTPTAKSTATPSPAPTTPTPSIIWSDDFESYTSGTFPDPPWTLTGNNDAYIDNTVSVSGTQSLKLFGQLGACWGAAVYREIGAAPPFEITVQISSGSEVLYGCHPNYGVVELSTGPSWTTDDRELIKFTAEGEIQGAYQEHEEEGEYFGDFNPFTFYKVNIRYEVIDSSTIRLTYWIDDIYKGAYDLPAKSYETEFSYIGLWAQEGTAWHDDVKIFLFEPLPTPPATPTPVPTASLIPEPSATPTPTPTATPTPLPTSTPSPSITPTPSIPPPSVPAGLEAVGGADNIRLTWDPNSESYIYGYNIYRSTRAFADYTAINEEVVRDTWYLDTDVVLDDTWYYRVSALNDGLLESGMSDYARATVGAIVAWMPDYRGNAGDEVTLLINATNATGVSNSGLDVQFIYDTGLLVPLAQFNSGTTVEKTALTEDFLVFDNSELADGQINISGIGSGMTIIGDGHLFDIKFVVQTDAAPGEYCEHIFVTVKLYDDVPNALSVDYTDTAYFTVAPDYIRGDVNGDGEVDSGDAILALKIATGEIIATWLQMQAGDINGDGVIDSADAILILRIAVGLPVNPSGGGGGGRTEPPAIYTLAVGEIDGRAGETVRAPVSIDDATGFSGADLRINYDPAIVTARGAYTTSLSSNFNIQHNIGSSWIDVAMSTSSNLSGGSGNLVELEFQINSSVNAGSNTALTLSQKKLSKQYGEDVAWKSAIDFTNGSITILADATPAPTSTPVPTPRPTAQPTPQPTAQPTAQPTVQPSTTPTMTPYAPLTPTPTVEPTPQPTAQPTVQPTAQPTATPVTVAPPWIYDYNGDGTSDIAIFRGSAGLWAVRGVTRVYFGGSADETVPGDYDGDRTTGIGIFRGSSGLWALRGVSRVYFGGSSDLPCPGDYDGDGTADVAVFRSSSGLWAIRGVTRVYFGGATDEPVPGYYNGDGTKDIGIFRPASGLWALRTISRMYFGGSTDEPVPGDYDGNGSWDVGIFRPSSGLWAIRGVTRVYFGGSADDALPADYSGDGMDRIGIFRGDSGLWAVQGVTRVYFGGSGDIPVTR